MAVQGNESPFPGQYLHDDIVRAGNKGTDSGQLIFIHIELRGLDLFQRDAQKLHRRKGLEQISLRIVKSGDMRGIEAELLQQRREIRPGRPADDGLRRRDDLQLVRLAVRQKAAVLPQNGGGKARIVIGIDANEFHTVFLSR